MDMVKDLLYYEQKWAQEVAVGVILSQPKPLWQMAIPFMFLFDFITRGKIRRRVSQYYLPPRESALKAAAAHNRGDDVNGEQITADCQAWLVNLKSSSAEAQGAAGDLIQLLINHYRTLLKTGNPDMVVNIRTSYPERESYRQILSRIAAREDLLDEIVVQKTGRPLRSELERTELLKHREKDLTLFYPDD